MSLVAKLEQRLAGALRHKDLAWSMPLIPARYRDDGRVIRGEFVVRAEDGGVTKPSEPIILEMKRSDTAIAGVMRSKDTTAGGKSCPVEYEVKVSDCKPDVLQVVAEVSAPVGDDCKRLSAPDGGAVPPDLREFRLERVR